MPPTIRKRPRPLGALKEEKWASLPDAGDRYRLLDQIGRGGEAVVSLAIDTHLKRQVAVKSLLPRLHRSDQAVERFLREGMLTARLHHPGIVPIHDIGVLNGALFFAMDKVEGQTLREILHESEENPAKWPKRRLLRIIERVCEIVAYAHSCRVAHRDLKPENIMVGAFDQIYVMDWGIAKDFESEDDGSGAVTCKLEVTEPSKNVTLPGQAKGTPNYMSPEQAMGMIKRIGYQSDVFALGIILYEVVAGKHPFAQGNVRDTMAAIKAANVTPITTSKEFNSICSKALAQAPNARYDNAQILYTDIQRAIDLQPISVHRDSVYGQLTKAARRRPAVATLLIVVALLLCFLANTRFKENGDVRRLVTQGMGHYQAMQTAAQGLSAAHQAGKEAPVLMADLHTHIQAVQAILGEALQRRGRTAPEEAKRAVAKSWLLRVESQLHAANYTQAFVSFAAYDSLPTKLRSALLFTKRERHQFGKVRAQLLQNHAFDLIDDALAACELRLATGGPAGAMTALATLNAVRSHPAIEWLPAWNPRYLSLVQNCLEAMTFGARIPRHDAHPLLTASLQALEAAVATNQLGDARRLLAQVDHLTTQNALPSWSKKQIERVATCRNQL